MKYTTIKLNVNTKILLDIIKPENKTYEEFIKELIDEYIKKKIEKNKNLREFLENLDIDPDSWKEIVLKAYKNLGIKDLLRLIELDPEMAKKIINRLR